MYGRTIPSDNTNADIIARLVAQLGFRRIAVLSLADGAAFAAYLKQVLLARNIEATVVEFTYGLSNDNIHTAVQQISALGLNIVVCATWSAQLTEIATAAAEFGLLSDKNHWIFTYMSRMPDTTDYGANPHLASLMNGSMWVTSDLTNNPNWDYWISQWPTFADVIPWYNSAVPPYGNHTSITECKDAKINFTLRSDFFTDTAALQSVIWTYAYDIVLAYGMAMCLNNTNGPIPPGPELYNLTMNLDFVGLSGSSLRFDPTTGDRDSNTAGFSFINWVGTVPFTAGRWSEALGEFDILPNVTFKSGVGMLNVPLDVTPPACNFNYLPGWARGLGYAEIAIVMFCCSVCFLWLIKNRHEKVVVNGQPTLLHMINFGCALAVWAILALTVDDQPGSTIDPSAACMATPVLFSVGMGITIAALTGKTYRVYKLFHNTKLRRMQMRVNQVLMFVAVFLGVLIALLAVWIGLAPLQWQRVVLFQNALGYPVESTGACTASPTSGAFLIVVFFIFLGSLLSSAFAANAVRQYPSEYHEGRFVLLALLSMTQLYLIAVPTTVAVYNFVVGRFIILSTVVFVSILFVNGFLLFPKIYRVNTGRDLFAETSGNDTGVLPLGSPAHALLDRMSVNASPSKTRGKSTPMPP
jgi:hypothetical protein